MIKVSGAICSLILIVPLAGCHYAFTQSASQMQIWKLDDNAHVVVRRDFSACLTSRDPSLNYNRFTVEVRDTLWRPLPWSKIELTTDGKQPEWNVDDYVVRTDEKRQFVWVCPRPPHPGHQVLLARSRSVPADAPADGEYGPDKGIELEMIKRQ